MNAADKKKLLEKLLLEREVTLKSIAFWNGHPEGIAISDGHGCLYDFREKHLTALELDLVSIEAALHVLETTKVPSAKSAPTA